MKTLPVLLLAITTTALAAPQIEEKVIAPAFEPGTIFTMSPKGMHLASMHAKASRFVVTGDVPGTDCVQSRRQTLGGAVRRRQPKPQRLLPRLRRRRPSFPASSAMN